MSATIWLSAATVCPDLARSFTISSACARASAAAPAICSGLYGTPSVRIAESFACEPAKSTLRSRIQAYSGITDFADTERGFVMCSRCQRFGYFPPSRARSGPVRLDPHWNG